MQTNGRGAAIRGISAQARVRLLVTVPALALLVSACTTVLGPTSPTPAPVSTAPIVFATSAPVAVQPPFATPVRPAPTATTARTVPTLIPTVQRPLYIANTGADGLTLRGTPDPNGERIAVLPDGAALTPTGPEQETDGRRWRQVRDTQGREGWVAADFLSASVPALAAAPASPGVALQAAPPTRAVAIPPPPPTPTRAPTRTPSSSAPGAPAPPAQPPAAKPQPPAVVVPTITRFGP